MDELTEMIRDIARNEAISVVDEKLKDVEKFGDLLSYAQASRYLKKFGINVKSKSIGQYAFDGVLEKVGSGRDAKVTKESVNRKWEIVE